MRMILALMVTLTGFSAAAQSPIASIEARQAIMQFVGSNMRTLSGIQRGRTEFNAETVRGTGQAMAVMLMAFPNLFPEGTETGGSTDALPAIFENRDEFRDAAFELEAAARRLSGIGNEEQFGELFAGVGATCQSCHSRFRK